MRWKGAMSRPTICLVANTLDPKYLVFRNNTYHFNSGGEPTDIPGFTLIQRFPLAFYRTAIIHPSNAVVYARFGDYSPAEIFAKSPNFGKTKF